MNNQLSFHEVRFPTDLALGAAGGPVRNTEIITLGSGKEQRNARWAHSKRRYNAGYGIKSIADLQVVIEFFEERRGRLHGFRFKDPLDWKSSRAGHDISALDQKLGVGDGVIQDFQLVKKYGDADTSYVRKISKPIKNSILIAIDKTSVASDKYHVDDTLGVVSFDANAIPDEGAVITAGYEFDIPVRFDSDEISINLSNFEAGDIPSIPITELLA